MVYTWSPVANSEVITDVFLLLKTGIMARNISCTAVVLDWGPPRPIILLVPLSKHNRVLKYTNVLTGINRYNVNDIKKINKSDYIY